jgi:predicted MFS family arabinose efflux permease
MAAARDVAWRGSQVLVVFGVLVLPLALVPGLAGVFAVALIAGAPFALLATAASVLVQGRVDPSRTTEAFSLLNAGLLAGSAAGSAVASALLGPFGPRAAIAVAAGGPLAAGCALAALIRWRRRRGLSVPAGRAGASAL